LVISLISAVIVFSSGTSPAQGTPVSCTTRADVTVLVDRQEDYENSDPVAQALEEAGDAGDPFRIENAADLIFLSTPAGDAYWYGAHFIQTANIDLAGCEWTPIGNSALDFSGSYDGQGYIVSGLSVTGSNPVLHGTSIGLFGYTDEFELSNLIVRGTITLPGTPSFWGFVGGVIGQAGEAHLENVRSEVDVEAVVGSGIGGLAGYVNYGSIDNSYYKGDITTVFADMAGGLVGLADLVTITSSYAITNFDASPVGAGLIGQENCEPEFTPEVSNSYAIGNGATYGIQADNCGTYEDTYWNSDLSANSATTEDPLTGTTARTTAELKTFSTYPEAWNMINGWGAYSASAPVKTWGICSQVNNGYPFLLREYTTDPCTVAPPPSNSDSGSSSGSVAATPIVVPVSKVNPRTIKQRSIRPASGDRPARLLGKSLNRDVLFVADSAKLSPQAKKSLRQAARLAMASDGKVAVTGFAAMTNRGSAYEKSVAQKRALAVARFLRARGFDDWIYFHGLSGRQGQAFEGDPRRVEIRILN
jgi:outer membrane protein OmpA-like peptidoglycan-associated protein